MFVFAQALNEEERNGGTVDLSLTDGLLCSKNLCAQIQSYEMITELCNDESIVPPFRSSLFKAWANTNI